MVFALVNGANAFADEMEEGDEVKLLRMRTKKDEIVIVPGKQARTLYQLAEYICMMIIETFGREH